MKEKFLKSRGGKVFLILFLTLSLAISTLSGILFGMQSLNHTTFSHNGEALLETKLLESYCLQAQCALQDFYISPMQSFEEYLNEQNKNNEFGNLRFSLQNEKGETLYSNFKEGEKTLYTVSDNFRISHVFWLDEVRNALANGTLNSSVLTEESKMALKHLDQYKNDRQIALYINCKIEAALSEELTAHDSPYYIHLFFETLDAHALALKLTFFASTVLSVACFILLLQSAGKKANVEGVYLPRRHKFPGDLLLFLSIGGIATIIALLCLLSEFFVPRFLFGGGVIDFAVPLSIFLVSLGLLFTSLIFSLTVYCLAVQTKAHVFWRYTCIGRLRHSTKGVGKRLVNFLKDLPSLWQIALVLTAFLACIGVCLLFSNSNVWGIYAFVWALAFALFILLLYRRFRKIMLETEEIAKGDLQKKVSDKHLCGDLKRHADAINQIGDSMEHAVEERMKSEHFKTELITNVSHDIKTPLTSIISYVDLLEKEQLQNENAKEYVAVLSRQSARLKKLIEDLLEASKASAGTLPVTLECVDLDILSTQILGEYEERFADKSLDFRMQKSAPNITVRADSRHLWRVLDNLFSNVYKYAMPLSRVYLDLTVQGGKAQILLRNMSKEPLHISAADLTERFVRGDASRNTEGSGLGLSIAKSLTELQGGTFDIQIDGDLFKVLITLPLA